jgi:hypothetical protein
MPQNARIKFITEISSFSSGAANQGISLRQMGPMPAQKSMCLVKKGGGSSYPDANFRRFRPATPLPRVS